MIVMLMATAGILVGQAGIPSGSAKIEVVIDGHPLEVFTYKPPEARVGPMIVVFHGVDRNADEYRDHARGMGDRFHALIVAPRFDKERFPTARYNRGGLLKADGTVAPREEWTWSLIPLLVAEVRRREDRPDLPFVVIGHSAGGQFVSRMAAFSDIGARRSIAANPSSWVFPTREMNFAYGFGGLPEELSGDEAIRRYLARPLTIYLGAADIERDPDLDKSPQADLQGLNRLERGRNAFARAERLARDRGWPFGWRLVEAPGVGHDHRAMFDSPACAEALRGLDQEMGSNSQARPK